MPPSKFTVLPMRSLVESSCVYLDRGRFKTGACRAVGCCNLFGEKNNERVGSETLAGLELSLAKQYLDHLLMSTGKRSMRKRQL